MAVRITRTASVLISLRVQNTAQATASYLDKARVYKAIESACTTATALDPSLRKHHTAARKVLQRPASPLLNLHVVAMEMHRVQYTLNAPGPLNDAAVIFDQPRDVLKVGGVEGEIRI